MAPAYDPVGPHQHRTLFRDAAKLSPGQARIEQVAINMANADRIDWQVVRRDQRCCRGAPVLPFFASNQQKAAWFDEILHGQPLAGFIVEPCVWQGASGALRAIRRLSIEANELNVEYGYRYQSAAVIPDGSPLPEPTDDILLYGPTTYPGMAIIDHADVRKMLLAGRALTDAGRALAVWTARQMDTADRHPDAAVRPKADGFVALLTPVVKAAFTDFGFEIAVMSQQVFGGHGYIREWGMEQYVRDARITQINEGTNGV